MLGHYLMFDGNCAEALDAYSKAFNVEVKEKKTYGDMPPNPEFPVAEQDKGLVLHARMEIDGTELMCADSSRANTAGNNMYISYTTDDEAAVRRAWDVLAEGGQVYMELTPSFFAAAHGSLRDRFGVNWMFTATQSA
jgi:PhnB protein